MEKLLSFVSRAMERNVSLPVIRMLAAATVSHRHHKITAGCKSVDFDEMTLSAGPHVTNNSNKKSNQNCNTS